MSIKKASECEQESYYMVHKVSDGWFRSHYEIVKLSKKTDVSIEWGMYSKRIWIRDGAIFKVKGDIDIHK